MRPARAKALILVFVEYALEAGTTHNFAQHWLVLILVLGKYPLQQHRLLTPRTSLQCRELHKEFPTGAIGILAVGRNGIRGCRMANANIHCGRITYPLERPWLGWGVGA